MLGLLFFYRIDPLLYWFLGNEVGIFSCDARDSVPIRSEVRCHVMEHALKISITFIMLAPFSPLTPPPLYFPCAHNFLLHLFVTGTLTRYRAKL